MVLSNHPQRLDKKQETQRPSGNYRLLIQYDTVFMNTYTKKYRLIYHPDVKKSDLPKIDYKNKAMIKRAIEERLASQPEVYGKPLQKTLKGYWKLRVGDFRVVFKITGEEVIILAIMHRKNIYTQVKKRTTA